MSADRNYDDVAAFSRTGAAGEVIFLEGDKGTDLFLVQEGRIELICGPHAAPAGIVEVGDIFGEWSFFEQQPRDVTARALTDFRIIKLDRPALDRITVRSARDCGVDAAETGAPAARPAALRRRRGVDGDARRASAHHPRSPGADDGPEPDRVGTGGPDDGAQPDRWRSTADLSPSRTPGGPGPGPASGTGPRLIAARSGKTFSLTRAEMIVGRADRATGKVPDVDLTDLDVERTLSRRHAKIVKRSASFFVCEEVSSRNGTFVNGQRLTTGAEVELHEGDEVLFGLVKTHFKQ